VVHLLFAGAVTDDQFAGIATDDAAIRGLRLVSLSELAGLDVRPPIHGFLERWMPGDPFVHLGQLWVR